MEAQIGLLGRDGYGQTLAALGTASLDDQSAILGRHADQKTVGPFSGGVARLECSFHRVCPLLCSKIVERNILLTTPPLRLSSLNSSP
jgi:hypothetical protein